MNKLLVSPDIGQHNAMEIFAVKRSLVSETSKVLLNDVFTEPDGSSEIKNIITDILNLGELQVDDILAKIRYGKKYKEIYTNQVNQALSRIVGGDIYSFLLVDHACISSCWVL